MTMLSVPEMRYPNRRSSCGNSSLAKCNLYLASLAKDYVPTEDQVREMATVQKILIPDESELQNIADETTTRAITCIFSLNTNPSEQKSILLKRGPIQLCDSARDLMLFTRGFVVANVDFIKIAEDVLNQVRELNEADAIDQGKLIQFYQSKGLPIIEEEITQLTDQLDSNSDGLLENFQESRQTSMREDATNSFAQKGSKLLVGLGQKFEQMRKSLTSELNEVPSQATSSQAEGRDKLLSRAGSDYTPGSGGAECNQCKVANAFLFSDIDRVETLDLWQNSEIKKYIYCPLAKDEGTIRQRAFAIFLRGKKGKKNEPLVVLCSNAGDVKDWMDAMEICIGEQKSMVQGRRRGSVNKRGKIFGINSSKRWWGSTKDLGLNSSINWDEDDI